MYTQDEERDFLESQLNLFTRMCWGNNGTTIYALDKDDQKLITFEETLLCAKNADLKPSLRSKYVRLMIGINTQLFCSPEEVAYHFLLDHAFHIVGHNVHPTSIH